MQIIVDVSKRFMKKIEPTENFLQSSFCLDFSLMVKKFFSMKLSCFIKKNTLKKIIGSHLKFFLCCHKKYLISWDIVLTSFVYLRQILQSFGSRMSQNLEVQQINPDVVIDKVQKDITDYLNMAVQSLKVRIIRSPCQRLLHLIFRPQNIVKVAEDTAKDVEYHFAPSQFEVENYTYNDLREFQMNPMENDSPLVTSGVHVPLDVFIGGIFLRWFVICRQFISFITTDRSVIRDIEWTNNDNILTQFMQNAQGKAPSLRQYIATHAGITRIYPGEYYLLDVNGRTIC